MLIENYTRNIHLANIMLEYNKNHIAWHLFYEFCAGNPLEYNQFININIIFLTYWFRESIKDSKNLFPGLNYLLKFYEGCIESFFDNSQYT